MGFTNEAKMRSMLMEKDKDGLDLSRKMFYDLCANTTVRLKDGETIKFNKESLCICAQSTILYQIFFGDLKTEITDISDIDFETFKSFLECIMGFTKMNFETCLNIFPVAWKYQCENFIDRCIKILTRKSTMSNENVCRVLNMATFYTCDNLIRRVFELYLDCEYRRKFLLESELLWNELEPDTVNLLMSKITIDSFTLTSVAKWAGNYLEENELQLPLRSFLEKTDLLQFFKVEHFETREQLSEFRRSKEGESILPFEMLVLIGRSENLSRKNSWWLERKEFETIEDDVFIDVYGSTRGCEKLRINIGTNLFVFSEDGTQAGRCAKAPLIKCEICVHIPYQSYDKNGHPSTINYEAVRFTCKINDKHLTECLSFKLTNNSKDLELAHFSHTPKAKLTWMFMRPCRVLLTSMAEWGEERSQLFFTKRISMTGIPDR